MIHLERDEITYCIEKPIRTLIKKLFNKSYDYDWTDTQKWWAGIVLKAIHEKGLELDRMDEKGHVRRKGDGIP